MGLIRFTLALFVVFSHASPVLGISLGQGDLAVQAFFIISGFYMSLILGKKYSINRQGILKFYTNRFLRLFPTYWVVLIAAFSLSPWIGMTIHFSFENYMTALKSLPVLDQLLILIPNLFLIGSDVTNFFHVNQSLQLHLTDNLNDLYNGSWFLLIPPAWSLGAEIYFYLLAPCFARCSTKTLIGFAIFSGILRIIIYSNGYTHEPWTSRFFPTEILFFLTGMLLQRVYSEKLSFFTTKNGIFGFFFMLILFIFIQATNLEHELVRWVFLCLFALCLPFVFHLTKSSHWDRKIGELSYSLYIVHVFVLQAVFRLFSGYFGNYSSLVVVLGSIGISLVLYLIVERPIDRFRQRIAN